MNFNTIIVVASQTTTTEIRILSCELPTHEAFHCRVFMNPGFVSDLIMGSWNTQQWIYPCIGPLFWHFIRSSDRGWGTGGSPLLSTLQRLGCVSVPSRGSHAAGTWGTASPMQGLHTRECSHVVISHPITPCIAFPCFQQCQLHTQPHVGVATQEQRCSVGPHRLTRVSQGHLCWQGQVSLSPVPWEEAQTAIAVSRGWMLDACYWPRFWTRSDLSGLLPCDDSHFCHVSGHQGMLQPERFLPAWVSVAVRGYGVCNGHFNT